jgi:hypothetical protein
MQLLVCGLKDTLQEALEEQWNVKWLFLHQKLSIQVMKLNVICCRKVKLDLCNPLASSLQLSEWIRWQWSLVGV